jgi:hypothetical protein
MRGKLIPVVEDGPIHVHRNKPESGRVWCVMFNHASIVNENSVLVIMKIANSFLTESLVFPILCKEIPLIHRRAMLYIHTTSRHNTA